MLDRLVRRPVLAEADRVVREDVDDALLHQRRHADRVAAVVAEGEEGAAVRDEAAVQGDAVHDRRHAELAHAVVDVAAAPALGVLDDRAVAGEAQRRRVRGVGQVRAGQVGAAAEQLGQRLRERLERRSGSPCGWRRSRPWRAPRPRPRRDDLAPARRQLARHAPRVLGGELGEGRGIGRERLAPRRLGRGAARRCASQCAIDLVGQDERRVRPAERGARRLDLVDAERFAVRLGGAGAIRRALADRRLAADQRRLAGAGARLRDRRVDRIDVVAVDARRSRSSRRPRSAWACRR